MPFPEHDASVRGADPVHSMAGGVKFGDAFAKVGFKVSFSTCKDATTALCDLVLPDNHSLESWGDAEPMKGVLGLQQPTMDPVFNTRATADVLIAVAKSDASMAGKLPSDFRAVVARQAGGNDALTAALPKAMGKGSSMNAPAPKSDVGVDQDEAPTDPGYHG